VFTSGAAPSADALRAAHAQLTSDGSLQFTFTTQPPPPPPTPPAQLPDWLVAILKGIGGFFQALGPIFGWIFAAGLAVLVLAVLYFVFRESLQARFPKLFKKKPRPVKPKVADWRPDAAAARQLLDQADKLAATGDFAAAVRLILHRSVEDIEQHRPRLVRPAFTSREIGRLDELPASARPTFAAIAEVVERSFFGGRPVDAAGFAECRRTYEQFAFPGAWA
jgi:hypothetical protein